MHFAVWQRVFAAAFSLNSQLFLHYLFIFGVNNEQTQPACAHAEIARCTTNTLINNIHMYSYVDLYVSIYGCALRRFVVYLVVSF